MPYTSQKIRLSEKQDRRVKLTTEKKEEIRLRYATGLCSLNSLAKEYGVSKKLILLTVNPNSAEKNKRHTKENWKNYSNREQLTNAARETRRYKQSLYLKGELIEEEREGENNDV